MTKVTKAKPAPKKTTKARGRKPQIEIDPRIKTEIVEGIRMGAYDYVAAEAAGISQTTFYRWLEEGEKPNGRKIYREFRELVLQARGEARAKMEIRVATENPLAWLKHVARDRPGRSGWTDTIKIDVGRLKEEALALAAKYGLDPDMLLAEAEAIAAGES